MCATRNQSVTPILLTQNAREGCARDRSYEKMGVYPRFGSRRIRIILRRECIHKGKERCGRLWAKAGLQVTKKRSRKRVGATLRPQPPTAKNSIWCYDLVYNACTHGQKIKCLTVIDEYTPECLAIDVRGSIRSSRIIDVLRRLMRLHGAPRYLRSDNALSSSARRCWNGLPRNPCKWHYISW